MRLFVAVAPPRHVVAALERVPRPEHPGVRWAPPEQWHVTLRFLGEVADVGGVAAALGLVPGRLRGLGAGEPEAVVGPATAGFAGGRVLQVPVAGLDDLAEAASWAVSRWAPVSDHPFVGHITVARARGSGRWPGLPGAGAPVAERFVVPGLALVASVLGAGGARHRVLHRVWLARP